MPRVIVLDAFPLSSVAKPEPRRGTVPSVLDECRRWVEDCLRSRMTILVPAVSYFETLRELERLNATFRIKRLRAFCFDPPQRFLSISKPDLDLAAKLWARARNAGTPTASAESLDADVILAAQAMDLGYAESDFIIATTNVGHLHQFVPCEIWQNILPGNSSI